MSEENREEGKSKGSAAQIAVRLLDRHAMTGLGLSAFLRKGSPCFL
jgi:hypothetical protein